jgi:F0F1-type ATP synthase assembly protein I
VKNKDKRQLLAAFSLAGSMGLSMVVTVAIGVVTGRVIDNWLIISPWGTVGGILLGMISGIWVTYKRIIEVGKMD